MIGSNCLDATDYSTRSPAREIENGSCVHFISYPNHCGPELRRPVMMAVVFELVQTPRRRSSRPDPICHTGPIRAAGLAPSCGLFCHITVLTEVGFILSQAFHIGPSSRFQSFCSSFVGRVVLSSFAVALGSG